MTTTKRSFSSLIGIGIATVAACGVCCGAPLLAIAGTIGGASVIGVYWIPALALIAVAIGIGVTVVLIRGRRARACKVPPARSSG
jgi:hypothetical protein